MLWIARERPAVLTPDFAFRAFCFGGFSFRAVGLLISAPGKMDARAMAPVPVPFLPLKPETAAASP